ncbi:MAG: ribonuclease H-like domain-containing protein [Candidatus Alectryocaccobium sp.]|nr:ribonuclease H-like domain-containing protein [Candidatus Alectryocaccobium sp.]
MLIEKDILIDDSSYYEELTDKTLCFDIETTGLSRSTSHLTVIGTGFVKDDRICFRQWLLENPSHEKELLHEFSDYVKRFDSILQFNGQSFDIPYISEKCLGYGMPDPFKGMEQLDIYRSAKRLKKILGLENCKQKSFENLYKIKRNDRISGRDCIFAYKDYLRYKDNKALNALLLHNEEDVTGLLKLNSLCILENMDDLPVSSSINTGFRNPSVFYISFNTKKALPFDINVSTDAYTLKLSKNEGLLLMNGSSCTKKYFFKDYKDYFYLPLEDTAIHKSVGIYVDSSHRRKATKETCYQKSTDLFFFEPCEIISPFFKDTAKSKELWINQKALSDADPGIIFSLLKSYIAFIFGGK